MSLNTQALADALKSCKGDLLQAASLLSCKPWEVNRAIQGVPELQNVMAAIRSQKASHADWDRQSADDFISAIEQRTALYKLEAMEEIREVAMMEAGENAELVKAKLQALFKLYGGGSTESSGDDLGQFLADLSRRYQESAPRISKLRVELELQRGSSAQSEALPALQDTSASVAVPQLASPAILATLPAKKPHARSRARPKQT